MFRDNIDATPLKERMRFPAKTIHVRLLVRLLIYCALGAMATDLRGHAEANWGDQTDMPPKVGAVGMPPSIRHWSHD
jgi:hypothetical protein